MSFQIREFHKVFWAINFSRFLQNFREIFFREISFRFRSIYFHEKMQNFAKKFAKCARKFSHIFSRNISLAENPCLIPNYYHCWNQSTFWSVASNLHVRLKFAKIRQKTAKLKTNVWPNLPKKEMFDLILNHSCVHCIVMKYIEKLSFSFYYYRNQSI